MIAFLSSAEFFESIFSKNSFRNTFRVSNRLDPDQARQNVGPDPVPNYLQRLSADGTGRQRISCLPRQNRSSEKEMQFFLKL